jgi:hypothetical protein
VSSLQPLPDIDPDLMGGIGSDEYIDSHRDCDHACMENGENECGCSWEECPDCGQFEYVDVCAEHWS